MHFSDKVTNLPLPWATFASSASMASPSAIVYTPQEDSASDYGSDFTPDLVEQLIAITSLEDRSAISIPPTEDPVPDIEDLGDDGTLRRHVRRQSANDRDIHYPVLAALSNGIIEVDVDFATTSGDSGTTSAQATTSMFVPIYQRPRSFKLTADQALHRCEPRTYSSRSRPEFSGKL